MRANTLKRRVVLTLFLLLCAASTHATEPLLIVTDPWAPYTFVDNGTVIGTDADITRAVFKRLGMDVKIQILPWKRCLAMVESRTVDAILAVSVTPERQQFIHFPEEAVSEGITVFFVKKDRKINFTSLNDLNDSRAGAMLGYSYCDEIDQSAFMRRAERVDTLEQLFNMLLLGRIDFLVEVDAVGYFTAKKMGILNQISVISNARYCRGGNHLGFSKKAGHDQLSIQFGKELHAFKKTPEYRRILDSYGNLQY